MILGNHVKHGKTQDDMSPARMTTLVGLGMGVCVCVWGGGGGGEGRHLLFGVFFSKKPLLVFLLYYLFYQRSCLALISVVPSATDSLELELV